MPPSERNPAPQEADDDIVDRTPSHPVTTTLLIVSSIALIMAIGLTGSEIGRYVNPATKSQLNNYERTAVQHFEEEFPVDEQGAPVASPAPSEG